MPRGRHENHARGTRHYRWNRGRMVSTDGYVKMRVGLDHPLADPNGYAFEHTLVWMTAYGLVPEGHIIHHRDGNRTNNQLDNLELLTRAEHNRKHAPERDKTGRFVGKRKAIRCSTEHTEPTGDLLDGVQWREFPMPRPRER